MFALRQLRQSDYDIRNSFNASYVWQTPWKFGNKFVNGAFGGWTLSQNFFARSGLPLTVLDSTSGVGNYNGNTPFLPTEVSGLAQGSCNQYGHELPERRWLLHR